MYARACPELRGWSGEQRDIIPAVKNLHPSGGCSGEHLASGIIHRQDHPPQTVKEGAKQEDWGHHGSDSPKTGSEPTIFMKMDYQEVLRREFHSEVAQELRRGPNFKQSSLMVTLGTV